MSLAGWAGGYLARVLENTYYLIKFAVPWSAAGLLLGLGGWGRASRLITLISLPALLILSAISGLSEPMDWLVLPLGLAAGLWLGERSHGNEPIAEPLSENNLTNEQEESFQSEDRFGKAVVSQDSAQHEQREGIVIDHQVWRWVSRLLSILLIVGVGGSLWAFPRWSLFLAVGGIAYGALLYRYPRAWMIVIPAALPLLDLAPWSGRFFWDEFDLLMLTTLAVALWQGRFRVSAWTVPKLGELLGLFIVVWVVSLLIGLLPLQPVNANAFSAYWSHYNSLRLAKGLAWGLVVYGLFRSQADQNKAFEKLSMGMALGVLGVSLWALWEEALFAGSAATADYRVTAGFSSMHTGGGHIEAYLVMALPFVWGLFFQLRNPLYRLLLGADFLFGTYALFFTVARGGAIALVVALMVLIWGTWLARRKQSRHRARSAVPLMMGLLALMVMVAGVSGVFWRERLQQTGTDAAIRLHHWAEVLDMRKAGVMTSLFGQGLGSFPAANLANQLPDQGGTYRYVSEGDNTYLALNSAGTLYMAQRVEPRPAQTLKLELSVRAPSTKAGLEASLCEKSLFNSRQCKWLKVGFKPGVQEWQSHMQTFNSGEVGAGNFLTRRPVQFSLYNPTPGTVVDVDNVRLMDGSGQNLLRNGDFSHGGDFWFFKSGNHLFWHAKNLWVHLLFEQGWLGMVLFTLILILALVRLARSAGRGELEATVLLASIGAWIIVGGVDSLVDAPRIALLVYGTLFIGAAWGAVQRVHVKQRRHRHHAPTHGGDDHAASVRFTLIGNT
jgi:hypothetical protein